MSSIDVDAPVIVAGGTGNVGWFVVNALIERGATVVVPSRSEEKVATLEEALAERGDGSGADRLHPVVGDIGDPGGAKALRDRITSEAGPPRAVVASLGRMVPAPSLLDATTDDLQEALDAYVHAHFVVARTFLPGLRESGGSYAMINGPLAFDPWPDSGAHLVSIAGAAQHMLFRSLAQELDDGGVRLFEYVWSAFIREKTTQPTSRHSGEAVAASLAEMILDDSRDLHGRSVQLESEEEVAAS